MTNFNLDLLRTFLIVGRLKSFSRASDYLYVDQSTISKKIHQLEERFGITLFVRTAKGVELTAAGRQFAENARRVLDDFAKLQATQAPQWSDLRIGAFDNIAAYCYPAFFADHLSAFRRIKIANEGPELVELFNAGELDLIIANGEFAQLVNGDFVSQSLMVEPLRLLAGPRMGDQIARFNSLADLRYQKLLIAPNYCPISQQLLRRQATFKDLRMVDYTATMLQVIRRTDYLTILPAGMVNELVRTSADLRAQSLTDLPQRTIAAFAREQAVLDKLLSAL